MAQAGTSSALAMSTRGALAVRAEHADRLARLHEQRLVVSSARSDATIASNAGQLRAARPEPP